MPFAATQTIDVVQNCHQVESKRGPWTRQTKLKDLLHCIKFLYSASALSSAEAPAGYPNKN